LQYEVDIPAAGVYAIAVRGYATGDYDNRIHAGVDGLWNASGANITLCETNRWSWSDCEGTNYTVEFSSAGIHQLMFSAADDGFEFDQFVLSDAPIASTDNQPELAPAVTLGKGVAFGAAIAPGVFALLGVMLLLRRRDVA
jgi:hypothetical protein